MEFHSEDKDDCRQKGALRDSVGQLRLQEDPDYKPRIQLTCTNGKYPPPISIPASVWARPGPGFWGQPQMEVMVRVDDTHSYHGWNWIPQPFLSMDKGTTRELIGARIFKVQIRGRNGPEIAEFHPLAWISHGKSTCDLTAKKPSKD
jgi:hypothetical protein